MDSIEKEELSESRKFVYFNNNCEDITIRFFGEIKLERKRNYDTHKQEFDEADTYLEETKNRFKKQLELFEQIRQ